MRIFACLVAAVLAVSVEARDHVAFINVDHAVDQQLFERTVTNDLQGIITVSAMVDTAKGVDVAGLVAAAAKGYPTDERKMRVYFVDDPAFPPQVTAPGFFAIINLRGLKKDADQKTYERRVFKMVLKGLAFACGFGANHDTGRCVMGAGSFSTLKGIDGTSASYSPFCYVPLSEYLTSRGLMIEIIPTFD